MLPQRPTARTQRTATDLTADNTDSYGNKPGSRRLCALAVVVVIAVTKFPPLPFFVFSVVSVAKAVAVAVAVAVTKFPPLPFFEGKGVRTILSFVIPIC